MGYEIIKDSAQVYCNGKLLKRDTDYTLYEKDGRIATDAEGLISVVFKKAIKPNRAQRRLRG